jgi:hypothetical protein
MELSKYEYQEKFSLCAIDRDIVALERIQLSLIKERKVLDRWFDKYLDMFDRKMNSEEIQLMLQTWQQMNQAFNENLSSKGKLNKIGGNIFPTATPDNEEALNKNWWA